MENSHAVQNGIQRAVGQALQSIGHSSDMWAILTQHLDNVGLFMPMEHGDGRWQVNATFHPTFAQAFADVMERYDAALRRGMSK